jgi:hypothetical protein
MRKSAAKIALIGPLALLLGFSSLNAAPQFPALGTAHEGLLIPIELCPGGKTARCQKRPKCSREEVAVCMCSVRATGTGELVCCRWKCSGGPF